MIAAAIVSKVGGGLWKLARIVLPIPLGVIAAAGLWLWLDRSSAIRQAVDKATTELVAGAKIDALEATADAERRLRMYAEMNAAEARRKAEQLAAANKELTDQLVLADLENEELLSDLEARKDEPAPPDGCVVDDALLERLRNR